MKLLWSWAENTEEREEHFEICQNGMWCLVRLVCFLCVRACACVRVRVKLVGDQSPPLWSCGQSSWLQIQRSGFDSWGYQIFWEVVSGSGTLKRGPFSLVNTIEELRGRNNSGSGLEIWEYGHSDLSRWPCTLYLQKLALTSLTSGSHLVGIVRSRSEATEFSLVFSFSTWKWKVKVKCVCGQTILSAKMNQVKVINYHFVCETGHGNHLDLC
jgi:hypothetical protein